ncbi:MAG: hypothetical protein NTV96_02330 [Actinobacteria bacterium]|nr:hypothetical protein [Actinomycetota bacterium]
MGESLSPVEVAREAQKHQEHSKAHGQPAGHWRVVQIAEAVLLAAVTVMAAWSGFAAAAYGTESRVAFAASSTADTDADAKAIEANEVQNFDESAFYAWLQAKSMGDPAAMSFEEQRCEANLETAFQAWLGANPETNLEAPSTPFDMAEYKRPLLDDSNKLRAEADTYDSDGVVAGNLSDQYIRLTVLLAGVLFLVGIGSTFTMVSLRYGLIGLGLLILILAIVYMVNLPQPDFNLGVPTQLVSP